MRTGFGNSRVMQKKLVKYPGREPILSRSGQQIDIENIINIAPHHRHDQCIVHVRAHTSYSVFSLCNPLQ